MKLNPGSNEARDAGCCCPVMDNARGKGAYGGGVIREDGNVLFWMNEDCALHGIKKIKEACDERRTI